MRWRRNAFSDRLQLPGWLQRGHILPHLIYICRGLLRRMQHQLVVLWGGTQYKDGEAQRQEEG